MRRLLYSFILVIAVSPGYSRKSKWNEETCKLGNPLADDQKLKRKANKDNKIQITPMSNDIIENSSKALEFLSSCKYSFVYNYVRQNRKKPDKMNPILGKLNLKSPGHWEKFTETQLDSDFQYEEAKEELESCVSGCTRRNHWLDLRGKAYEELLEKYTNGETTQKPDYSCPKCVKYLPARSLVKIPDALWGIKPRTPTTRFLASTKPSTTKPSTTTPEPTTLPTSDTPTPSTSFTPPVPTRKVKCGYQNIYGDIMKCNLNDPDDPARFGIGQVGNLVFGNKTDHGEFPWQASLREKVEGETFCGGTLINSWTVVTAAHCVHEGNGGDFKQSRFIVGLGWQKAVGMNRDILEENRKFGEQVINIDLRHGREKGRVFVHPGYIGEITDDNTNIHSPHDIAIIVLSEEVKFPENADVGLPGDDHELHTDQLRGTFVRPVCMPHLNESSRIGISPLHPYTKDHQQASKYPTSEYLHITGFGKTNKTSFDNIDNIASDSWKINTDQLMKAYLGTLKNHECQRRIREKSGDLVIWSKQICGLKLPNEKDPVDTCQGDSGGPAVKLVDFFLEQAVKMGWDEDQKTEEMMKRLDSGEIDVPRGQLVGITSWGFGCGEGTPGIYTRVSEYMDWIKQYTSVMYTVDDQEI